jgi:HSP20 family molecular chaperone IbpA
MNPSPFHGIFSALQRVSEEQAQEEAALQQAPQQHYAEPMQAQRAMGAASGQAQVGRIAVDIYEQDDYYIIKAPIAGVKLSDMDIEVNENVITIRGHRKQQDSVPQNQYYLQECFWGDFSRSVTLPITIDPKKVRATFNKDCILKILIPKEEKVKIVKISEA